jgi:hypothetical protein
MSKEQKQKKRLLFGGQFLVCILGSLAILLFAMGLESGHSLAEKILLVLTGNILLVFALCLGICGWTIAMFLRKRP